MRWLTASLIVGFVAFVACDRKPSTTTASAGGSSPLREPVGDTIDIDFASEVHLVGVHIEPRRAKRGGHVVIGLRWRCDKAPGPGWLLLTHVLDASGRPRDNLDFEGPLRQPDADYHDQVRGPAHWEAGKTFEEALDYEIPSWAAGQLTVVVGLFKGPVRLHVVSGPNDGADLGIAGKIDVD